MLTTRTNVLDIDFEIKLVWLINSRFRDRVRDKGFGVTHRFASFIGSKEKKRVMGLEPTTTTLATWYSTN